MYITPCPKCGRLPEIWEGYSRNGIRHRHVGCPRYCNVLKAQDWNLGLPTTFFYDFSGDGDDNTIFKKWDENLIFDPK